MDYVKIASDYDALVQASGDPSQVNNLAEIGESLANLEPSAVLAKAILSLDAQLAETTELMRDPQMSAYATEEHARLT
ncbi:TPA: hypothetical protein DD448_01295, partial [Candidatus Collierbacteria bacterium]|nr:hypothetical protein [Candidatus Collierbacteria bacterium]